MFSPRLLEPQWFIPFLAVMWPAASGALALLSGWWTLASHFRASDAVAGERFRFVSGSLGRRFFPVKHGNCLFLTVNDEGFRLAILLVFRFLSPPLFIPWARVESVTEKRVFFVPRTEISIRETWPRLSIYGRVGKSLQEAYARAQAKKAP